MVHSLQQILDHADLVADLGPTEDGDERAFGRLERVAEVLQLLLDQEAHDAGALRQQLRHVVHADVLAVTGAERVVDVHFAQLREPLRQLQPQGVLRGRELLVRVLLGLVDDVLALVEADVLQQEHLAVRQLRHRGIDLRPQHLRHERDRPPQKLAHPFGHGLERELGVFGRVARRPPEVAGHNGPAALLEDVLERGQEHANPAVVRHVELLVERHIQVGANEDPPSPDV